jgi:PAS domain S-box-containing protein
MTKENKISRLLEVIVQNTPDLIYAFDLNYKIIYANKALLEMWGRTLEDSLGRDLTELGYETWHANMHKREIDEIITTKKPIRGEVSFNHATLGKRIYDYIFVPVFDTQGHVEAISGTTRDITNLVEAKNQIEESEQRFRTLVDNIPMMSFILEPNPDAKVSYWNKGWLDYTGQNYNEALGRSWDRFIHP